MTKKIKFSLMLRLEKPFGIKTLRQVDNVKHAQEIVSTKLPPKNSHFFVGKYEDGVLVESTILKPMADLTSRFKRAVKHNG